jgi:hypothetical protein
MSKSPSRTARAKRSPGGSSLGRQASADARRRAAAVLEVLGGERTPAQAAGALGVSVPRYYLIEQRALAALVAACEPAMRGRRATPQRQIAALERQIERLSRDSARYQSLARLAQRTLGLAPPTAEPRGRGREAKSAGGKKRRARRPTVRALGLAASLAVDTRVADSPGADSCGANSSGEDSTRGIKPLSANS